MNRLDELASNRFCRTCFVQDENEIFSEILDTTTQMELLSIGNIEVNKSIKYIFVVYTLIIYNL